MKQVNGHQIIQLFETWAPKRYAEDWDSVGLQVGQLNRSVTKVLVSLDVDERIVDEAIARGAELIIAHHPLLFRPLKRVWTDTPEGRIVEKCIKHDIQVYAAHTNLDVAEGGVNDLMADALQLENTTPLMKSYGEDLYKLVVFAPLENAEAIRQALGDAGAGEIGEYTHCSYEMIGTGRFTPSERAKPHIGRAGEAEEVEEVRIEVIIPHFSKSRVMKALLQAHPYEEPAFDLIPLAQQTDEKGLGRIGTLAEPMTLREFAEHAKRALNVPAVRVVGDVERSIKKVAVLGGSGSKYIHQAKQQGADVYVTGDMDFHTAQTCEKLHLAIVDPGHHAEKVMIAGVAEKMDTLCEEEGYEVEWLQSEVNTETFTFL